MVKEIDQNKTWQKQSQQLKKVQFQFEFLKDVDRQIKLDAIERQTTPSNIVRDLLGLKPSGPIRPRLGVSLSPGELELLGDRFNVDPDDRRALVRRATEAVHAHYSENKSKRS